MNKEEFTITGFIGKSDEIFKEIETGKYFVVLSSKPGLSGESKCKYVGKIRYFFYKIRKGIEWKIKKLLNHY